MIGRRELLTGAAALAAHSALADTVTPQIGGGLGQGFDGGLGRASRPLPASLPNLALWLSAEDYNATTGTWTAKVGPNFANAGGSKPTLATNVLNGRPVVRFSGTQFLTGAFNFSGDDFTVYVVGRQTTAKDNIAWIAETDGTTATGFAGLICGTIAGGRKYGLGKFGVSTNLTGGGATVNTFECVVWRSRGTPNSHQLDTTTTNAGLIEILMRQNGAFNAQPGCGLSGFPMSPPASSMIGAAMDGSLNGLIGDVAEILVFKQCQTNYQIVQAEGYLAAPARYNLSVTRRPAYAAEAFDGWVVNPTPVLRRGSAGSFDESLLEGPAHLVVNGNYYLTYSALSAANVNSIAQAVGTSPFNLVKTGTILTKSASAWDSAYVSGGTIVQDPQTGLYHLLYFGSNAPGFEQPPASIAITAGAASPAGPFTNAAAPILDPTAASWDSLILYRAFVLYFSGTYYLYYNAKASSGPEKIGIATASNILGPYTKYAGNPVMVPAGGTDANRIGDPHIIRPDPAVARWVMHYFGGVNASIGESYLAESTDLLTWTKYANAVYLRTPGLVNSIRMSVGALGGYNYEAFCDNLDIYYETLATGP